MQLKLASLHKASVCLRYRQALEQVCHYAAYARLYVLNKRQETLFWSHLSLQYMDNFIP